MGTELVSLARAEERVWRCRAALEALTDDAELASLRAERDRLARERAGLHGEALELEHRIAQLDAQRHELGRRQSRLRAQESTADYRDQERLDSELDTLRRRLEELDEGELEAMEALDELRARETSLAEHEALTERRIAALEEALEGERARRAAELSEAKAHWAALLGELDEPVRRRIEGRARRGRSLALVDGSRCSVCHMTLSQAVASSFARGESVDCESCGAWLVGEA